MRPKKPHAKRGAGTSGFRPQADDLSELLRYCRELSNILDAHELYAALIQILAARLAVDALAVFVYEKSGATFENVYSRGALGDTRRLRLQDLPFRRDLRKGAPIPTGPAPAGSGKSLSAGRNALPGAPAALWHFLVMREEIIGLLALGPRGDGRPFSAADLHFLKEIASHAAVCMHTCRLYGQRQREKEDLDKTLQNLSLLYSIGKAINYISDLKKLLQYILSQAIEITGAEKGSIMLYDMESGRLHIRVLAGLSDVVYQDKVNANEIQCRSFRPGEGIAGRVFLSGKPLVVNNVRADDLFVASETSFVRSIACIPMVVYNEGIGVINVTNKSQAKDFSDEDVHMLKAVADQAAVAVNKAQLWDMAITDSLTGLRVRRYFMMKLQEEIHRAERYGKVLSVIMADLDHFKAVNDTYGHAVGDRMLKLVGQHLLRNVRDVDVLARYGGEEFMILLPDTDKDAAFCLSERLRRGLEGLRVEDLPALSMSLGIAGYPVDADRLEDLIQRADAALYAAKQAGRNRTVCYCAQTGILRPIGRPECG